MALHKAPDAFEMPSDFQGILYVPFDGHGAWKMKLVKELLAAGFTVDANDLIKT